METRSLNHCFLAQNREFFPKLKPHKNFISSFVKSFTNTPDNVFYSNCNEIRNTLLENDENYAFSPPPIFVVRFSKFKNDGCLIAACDEDGYITFIDSRKASKEKQSLYRVHKNSVFDMTQFDCDNKIATASGDQTARVQDLNSNMKYISLEKHSGSVKSVCANERNSNLLATAARDGDVHIQDLRTKGNNALRDKVSNNSSSHDCFESNYTLISPIQSILRAHNMEKSPLQYNSINSKRSYRSLISSFGNETFSNYNFPESNNFNRYQTSIANSNIVNSRRRARRSSFSISKHGVTSVLYLKDDQTIATAGAVDGKVKLQDMRRLKQKKQFECLTYFYKCNDCVHPHGISSIDLCSKGSKILVSSTDHKIWIQDFLNLSENSSVSGYFGGHTSSFYVKAIFSPDNNFILSGSVDNSIYIQQREGNSRRTYSKLSCNNNILNNNNLEKPLIKLEGHSGEVTGISQSNTDLSQIASCSDDSTIRLQKFDSCLRYDNLVKERDSRCFQKKFVSLKGVFKKKDVKSILNSQNIQAQKVNDFKNKQNESFGNEINNVGEENKENSFVNGDDKIFSKESFDSNSCRDLNKPSFRNLTLYDMQQNKFSNYKNSSSKTKNL